MRNRTRDLGCSQHPVFPAPSDFEEGDLEPSDDSGIVGCLDAGTKATYALADGRAATRLNQAVMFVLAGSERLADRGRKGEEAIEQDVGQRETFAATEILPQKKP